MKLENLYVPMLLEMITMRAHMGIVIKMAQAVSVGIPLQVQSSPRSFRESMVCVMNMEDFSPDLIRTRIRLMAASFRHTTVAH